MVVVDVVVVDAADVVDGETAGKGAGARAVVGGGTTGVDRVPARVDAVGVPTGAGSAGVIGVVTVVVAVVGSADVTAGARVVVTA